jgi:hypothetical protein
MEKWIDWKSDRSANADHHVMGKPMWYRYCRVTTLVS